MSDLNILYIHSHDTGRYVQPYGYAIPTPNIQRLAEKGVLFRRAFDAAPTCSPSRAALLTGAAPHSCGMFGLVNRGFELRDKSKHLACWLKARSFTTALVGVQHVVRDPRAAGYYDTVVATDTKTARVVAPAAADYLGGGPKEPFFMSVGFSETHRAFSELTPVEDPRYCQPPTPLPDTPAIRRDMACYKNSAARLDRGVGLVLQALQDAGLADRTLVICTTDHGIAFPKMKCHLTDHGTGVMLILQGPGGFSGGRVLDSLVSQIDLFPTICELIGEEPPSWLEGTSLMPLIRGECDEVNEGIFAEVNYHCPYEPQRSVRTQRHRYVRRYIDRETPLLGNCDGSPSKEELMAVGWTTSRVDKEQLYDLMLDPTEAHNLAADQRYQSVLQESRSRLDAWMERTGDPLLQGPVPPAAEAVVNRPDDVEPQDVWAYTTKPGAYA